MLRTGATMGNRLATQKENYLEDDEEMKRKAMERALMNRLSSTPGKASS
jgi:hypothetical protein